MYALGIHIEGKNIKAALVCKVKGKISIELTHTSIVKPIDIGEFVPHGTQAIIVSGLEASQMVHREISFKLKSEQAILKALPFQLESAIPYPPEESIVIPRIQEGVASLFATTRKNLNLHLDQLQGIGIEPDQISSVGSALARWAVFKFPDQPNVCVMHDGNCILTSRGKVCILQAYEDQQRMAAYILAKCPDVFFAPSDPYTIAIGLALEGLSKKSLQFRQGEFIAPKEKRRTYLKVRAYVAVSLALTLGIGATGFYKSIRYEKMLHRRIDETANFSTLPLEKRLAAWKHQLDGQKKEFPFASTAPSVQETLAWLSSKKEEVDVVHLHYALTSYPKLGEKIEPYRAKVNLEFTAPTPAIAKKFYESLRLDSFVREISWEEGPERYKTSFYLRSQ